MAIKKKENQEQAQQIKVLRAYEFESGDVSFSMEYKGIGFYDLVYKTESDKIKKPFVSFPSRKSKDGKYYNYYQFKISDEMLASIESQIGELI